MESLHRGASGDEVSTLQSRLYALRYTVHATAVYDDETITAVRAFRTATWGEPGAEDCDPDTFAAVGYYAAQAGNLTGAEPDDADDAAQASVVDSNGKVLAEVAARKVKRLGKFSVFTDDIEGSIDQGAPKAHALRALAFGLPGDVTVAAEIEGDAVFDSGWAPGMGIYVTGQQSEGGIYESFDTDAATIASLPSESALFVVVGGPQAFAEPCWAAQASSALGMGGNGAVLFSADDNRFIGFCLDTGIGHGAATFIALQDTWLTGV